MTKRQQVVAVAGTKIAGMPTVVSVIRETAEIFGVPFNQKLIDDCVKRAEALNAWRAEGPGYMK